MIINNQFQWHDTIYIIHFNTHKIHHSWMFQSRILLLLWARHKNQRAQLGEGDLFADRRHWRTQIAPFNNVHSTIQRQNGLHWALISRRQQSQHIFLSVLMFPLDNGLCKPGVGLAFYNGHLG